MCYGQTTEEIVAAKTSRKERLAEEGHLTVGLDVGDASINYLQPVCVANRTGEIRRRGAVRKRRWRRRQAGVLSSSAYS